MTRLIAIGVLSLTLSGCVTSPLTPAPIVQTTSSSALRPPRPATAPQSETQCIHDEGYGRWTDCGSEM